MKWMKLKDRMPSVEIDGKKVLLYRLLNEGQKELSISIHDKIMTKHCDKDETWWIALPDKPKQDI